MSADFTYRVIRIKANDWRVLRKRINERDGVMVAALTTKRGAEKAARIFRATA